MNRPTPTAPTVYVHGSNAVDLVAFVTVAGTGDVRVRFSSYLATTTWRCDRCGHSPHPACPHARAVAALVTAPTAKEKNP